MANNSIYPPVRFNLGRPLKLTPNQLLQKFREYVQWCVDNPIVITSTTSGVSSNGSGYSNETKDEKPRLVSIGGFLVFIGESRRWWGELDNSKRDFSVVKDLVREFCEDYQKEMASANVFNANIISRLLGLADKQQVEATAPINLSLESPKALEGLKAALASGAEPRKPKDEE